MSAFKVCYAQTMSPQPDFTAYLGQILRAARESAGFSQQELGDRAGVTPRFIQELEHGRSDISLGTLLALTRALDTTLSAITGYIDESLKNNR